MIPEWLRPTDDQVLNMKYPVTPSHREVQRITFESLFERALEDVMEGKAIKALIESDPRGVSYGQFMKWVRSNPDRSTAMDEAEAIGTDVTADELKEISDGDGLEDVQRSTLRVNTRKWLMQSRNKKKYGEKQIDTITVNVDMRDAIERAERMANDRRSLVIDGEFSYG